MLLSQGRPTGIEGAKADAKPNPSLFINNSEPTITDDVIVIGGSFADLAGALQLGRARRNVSVLDTGLPRNRFAGHSHGMLGHDHKPPLDILAEAAAAGALSHDQTGQSPGG